MEVKSTGNLSMIVMCSKALLVWLLANLGGTAIMMTVTAIRGGFERPEMMVSLGGYIALVSIPAAAILPAFFYWLIRVRIQLVRIICVVLFSAAIEFLTVCIICRNEAGIYKVIRNAILLSPYALSAAAAIIIVAKDVVFYKEAVQQNT